MIKKNELSELKHKLNYHTHLDNIYINYKPLILMCFILSATFCFTFLYKDDLIALALSITFLLVEWILVLHGINKVNKLRKYYGY